MVELARAGGRRAGGDAVVDAGAGLGLLTFELARKVQPGGRVIAVEPAADCREQLQATCRTLGFSSVVEVRPGVADALPLEDQTCDLVVCRSVLLYVPDRRKALREFARVLKPNGRLVCSEPINIYAYRTGRLHRWFDLTELGEVATAIRKVEEHYFGHDDATSNFTEDQLLEEAIEAGFTNLRLVLERFVDFRSMTADEWKSFVGWDQPLTATHPSLREALSERLSVAQLADLLEMVERQVRERKLRVDSAAALLTGSARLVSRAPFA